MKTLHLLLPIAATLAGCASAPLVPLDRPSPEKRGEVIVYRESALAAAAVGLTVGTGANAFAVIGNDEKVRALLPTGEHEVFVRARSAEPSKVRVNLRNGETVCLRTSSSPSTYAKVLVPITLIATGYHFYLDQVPCPAQAELSKYKDVAVTYR
jgi:hypothetical protein